MTTEYNQELVEEFKEYIAYWVDYRDTTCASNPEGSLKNTMIFTCEEIIQKRIKELTACMECAN